MTAIESDRIAVLVERLAVAQAEREHARLVSTLRQDGLFAPTHPGEHLLGAI